MDKLYSIQEVAAKLNLSDKTLRRWEEAGRFTSSRTLGNQRRYSLEDLQILDAIKHGTINEQKDLLTIHQAAKLCGVTPTTIIRWENDGKIHPFITSDNTYYQKSQLIEKMEELKKTYVPQTEPAPIYQQSQVDDLETSATIEPNAPNDPIDEDYEEPIMDTKPRLTPLNPQPFKDNSIRNNVMSLTSNLSPSFNIQSVVANVLISLILIVTYHFLFNSTPAKLKSPQTGSVQGVSTMADPTLDLLRTILDPSGSLTTTTLTSRVGLISPTLSLNPSSAPSSPTPGTIYYDASSQMLKVFKGAGWVELSPTSNFKVGDATLVTGLGILHKGKNQVSVTQEKVTSNTPVTITFTNDYAPAKKYWVTPDQGSFTVYTDFPVSADSQFAYNFITPNGTASASPKP